MKKLTHCQICGRAIKTVAHRGLRHGMADKVDVIAHHGYTRPGWGYQTASCFGARWRPYEVARDAIEALLPQLRAQRERTVERHLALLLDPPAELTRDVTRRFGGRIEREAVARPEGWEIKDTDHDYRNDSYTRAWNYATSRAMGEARWLREFITDLERRHSEWGNGPGTRPGTFSSRRS